MIKTIETTTWNDIEKRITQLPDDKQRLYQDMKSLYDAEISSSNPDNDKVAALIAKNKGVAIVKIMKSRGRPMNKPGYDRESQIQMLINTAVDFAVEPFDDENIDRGYRCLSP